MALGREEASDRCDRTQVPFRDFLLFQRTAELALQKPDQFDHADRIDHAAPEQRILVLQRPVGPHVEEVVTDVGSRAVRDHRRSQLSGLVAHGPDLGVTRQAAAGASAAGHTRAVAATRARTGSGAPRNSRCHNSVERIATSAWLSRNPSARPARQRRTNPATACGLKIPVRARLAGSSSSSTYSAGRPSKKAGTSGARYGCLRRRVTAGGTRSVPSPQRRRMSFSRRPRSLLRAGSAAANSNSRWSRYGTRASTPCAIAMRSPCELSRYDESSVVISRYAARASNDQAPNPVGSEARSSANGSKAPSPARNSV